MSSPPAHPQDPEPLDSGDRWTLIFLFLVAFGFRLYRLWALDVWFDEVAVLLQTQMSFAQIWDFCKSENFPPLYPWLLKIWGSISPADNWMRLFSALLGSLIPPLAYLLGRELRDRTLGLLLGLACLLALPLYYYSQVVRMYSQFVLLSLLSYYALLRALRQNQWRYWFLMAAVNLLNFYTFLFAAFIILAEAVVILWRHRWNVQKCWRPLLSHLPALLFMSFWVLTLLHRYQAQQSYVPKHLEAKDLLDFWIFFGTGVKVPYRHLLMIVLNLPFALGLLLTIRSLGRWPSLRVVAVIAALSFAVICALSIVGQSLFFDRYMLFLLPIYLALAFSGWLDAPQRPLRLLGVVWIISALLYAQGYYHSHHRQVNDVYRYHGVYTTPESDDGHSMSRNAIILQTRLAPDEVILHFSDQYLRSFSYFNFLYYHQRALPEFVYSAEDIPPYCGGQYVRPGERIHSLQDLPQLPLGVWVVSLNDPDFVVYGSAVYEHIKKSWVSEADLARDLHDLGFDHVETIRDGAVSLIHFRRSGLPDSDKSIKSADSP